MKTFDISNSKHLALLLALAATVSNQTVSADIAEDFESYSDGQSLNAVNQWVGDATVSATSYPYNAASIGYPITGAAHTKVMNVAGVVDNTAGPSDYSMVTWSDMIVKPGQFRQAVGHPNLHGNSPVGFYINASGHPVVAHTEYGTGNMVWTEISDVTLSASDYHRVTVQMDYRSFDVVGHHRYYAILINGEYLRSASARADQTGAVAGGQWFPMLGDKAVAGIAVSAGSASLDDVILGSGTNYSAVSVSAPSVYEVADGQSSSHDFVIELNQASDLDVTIDYTTQDGTATAGSDYTAVSGQVVIPAGQTQAVVSVDVHGDAIDDSGEAFSLSMTRIQNAVVLDPQDTNVLIIDDSGDEDEDGLSNGEEIALGTDPLNYDSDGDSFSDYFENLDGSDPLDASSTPTNSQNLAPFFAARESGKLFGNSIINGQHEYTETYSGTEVTFRAFNSSDSPVDLITIDTGRFGAGVLKYKAGSYVTMTFDRDTYLDEIGFGSWVGTEGCRISGDAIAAFNGIDDTAENTFAHDPVVKTLDIYGAPNPVPLIDNVTGDGLLIPAGSEIQITFLNNTASLSWLSFQPRITVDEDATIGTLVQSMQPSDPNQNDVLTTEIIAGNDSGLFAVDNAGNVSVAGTLDYNTAPVHTLTLAVTDLGGLVTQKDLKIFVTEFDSDNDGLEDAWEIANFGDLTSQSGSDDADNDGLTNAEEYALNSDPNSTDSDSDGVDDALEVAYGTDPADGVSTPVIEAPVFAEVVAAFTTVGAVNGAADYIVTEQGITMTILPVSTLTDPDQIGLVSTTMGVVGSTGGSKSTQTVGDGETLSISFDADVFLRDFDAGNRGSGETTYLTSTAFDGLTGVVGAYDDATDTISAGGDVLGMNADGPGNGIFIPANTPVDFTVSAGGSISYKGITVAGVNSVSVAENVSVGTEVASAVATDSQAGEQLTYAITAGNDSGLFAIDSNGAITTTGALDYETATSHTLTVTATDLAGLSAATVVHINVYDVVENTAPTVNDATFAITENSAPNAAVGTVSASDPENDTLSYAITAGNAGGEFTIDSATGAITTTTSLNYEAASQYVLTVEVSDGALTDTATITVDVSNVNEAPAASDIAGGVNENLAGGQVIGSVGVTDPDSGDSFGYAIVAGNTAGFFAIDTNGQVTTTAALDFETANAYALTVEVTDAGGLTDTANVTVTVGNVNEAPVASDLANTLGENGAAGAVVGSVVANDPEGDSLTYQIIGGNAGLFAIDANGQVTTTGALNFEAASQHVLTVQVSDGSLSDTATVTVNVTDVNEAPTVSNASGSVAENGSAGAVVGSVATSDPEGDNLTFQITGGNASGHFTIDANGQVTTTGALDHEAVSQYVLTVEVSDGTLTGSATVTVDVTDVNEAPTASNTSGSVGEDVSSGSVIATVVTSDPEGDSLSYQITAGNASGHFAIDANGQITTTGTLNFEAASQHVLTVQVSDGTLTDTAQVIVNVTDVNEAPIASNSSGSVAENGSAGAVIGSVATSDPEGDNLTFQITGGNASGHFAIDANGQITTTGTLDFEAASQHVLTVQVSDGELSDTATVTVNVTDVNEAPTASNASGSVAENGSAGVVIGTVASSDPEGDNLTFQITNGNASGFFAIDANGQVTTTGELDFESATQHVLTVEVSDSALTDRATVTVDVTDVNEAPSVANNSASIAEDTAVGTTVVSVSASDPDAGASLSYSITAGNTGNAFSIDSSGNIKVASALDYETTTSYNLTVQVSDGSLADTAQITVNVTDVVEVSVASIATGSASNISMNSADLGYSITDDGNETPTVTLYYGESDGGQSAGAWANSTVIGAQAAGSYAEPLTGLTEGTDYFYTVSATNSAGTAWGSTANFTTEADTTPKLVRTTVSGVSSSTWTTVDLGQNYNSAVIIATPIYPAGTTTAAVTRIRNVSGSSFELKLGRADGQTGELNLDVSVVAVEEGVYTLANDGVQMEAVKFTSTVTAENNSWSAEARTMQNSYTAPVVVGQVMSYNDSSWSAFWAMGNTRTAIPSTSNFNVGKHVGEDPNVTRADETVGYIVIETGTGSINGVAYEAAVGSKSIRGFGNKSNPYTYSLSGDLSSASAAAVSSAGMAGSNGGWSVLSGATPIEATSLDLHICEDQMADTEQSHNTTQVGYLIFE